QPKAKAKPSSPPAPKGAAAAPPVPDGPSLASVRLAVEDMIATFGPAYPKGPEYLRRLTELDKAGAKDEFAALARRALLANPLLDFDRLLVIKRDFGDAARRVMSSDLGTPKLNSHCNSSIPHPESGWDNEFVILSDLRGAGRMGPLYKPTGGRIVVDPDLHFDADRFMFSMISEHGNWGVFEIGAGGKGLRRLTPDHEDVEFYDSCYGPDGQIYFACNAAMQGLPCERGKRPVVQLYRMDLDTRKIRQVTFEQDTDWCPTMMPDGRVLYLRWEYSDTPHYFTRILMTMNPDGTSQMEHYGSNSYWPNGIFNARPIPGEPTRVIGVVGGHHGISRSGRLVIFDTARGRHEADGAVREIPRSAHPVEPIIRDRLVDGVWPQFIYPYPLSAKYHLVSMKRDAGSLWGIYLVDVFDNVTLIKEVAGSALLEAQPLRKRPRPGIVPDRVDLGRKDALVYLVDVYRGAGLAGIPRGKVARLRLFAYHFGYNFSANHDFVGIESSWDIKRILGTVPVEKDGSALFRVPANTPISIQPLDEKGRALQLMRSWMVGMPGETVSCVGCHEKQHETPPVYQGTALGKPPAEIAPWLGPARGFSFRREVQPVLDKYCLACHGGDNRSLPDFSDAGGDGFSAAYRNLQLYVRRPGPEGDYHLTTPMEYHAGTSELIQMLRKGHHNVQPDEEAWQRLYAWIDLNAPYCGTWSEHAALQEFRGLDQRKRRREFAKLYAGLDVDPEADADLPVARPRPIIPKLLVPWPAQEIKLPGWPFDAAEAARRQARTTKAIKKTIDLGGGVTMDLVLVPAGRFIMGDADGDLDERPRTKAGIDEPFWMGALEVTNEQFAAFDPAHDSRYIDTAGKDQSSRGFPANGARQPVVRVSWREATAFCQWLHRKTGGSVALPTEAQWEYACRAGSETALSYGEVDADFSRHANVADAAAFAARGKGKRGGLTPFPAEGRFNDRAPIVRDVGGCEPNAWGLGDMHGNVAEWTRSVYRPYPYSDSDGRNDPAAAGLRVVRGGSWRDRPKRCRSAFRLAYEPYQRVVNVGFRVVMACE
ncbi:MAG: SUMF1/EgtB/PvdO family nonheme iron enzyme, partial [Phycisphaerae bacterium]